MSFRLTNDKKYLVALDFDGTITTKDTLLEFTRFVRGKSSYLGSLFALSPTLLAFKLGLTPAEDAKGSFLTYHFGDMPIQMMRQKAVNFTEEALPDLIRPKALERIQWHKDQGHTITIVTASLQTWVKPWCDKMGIGCIGSLPEVKDGKFTGKLSGPNCNGQEKVTRLLAEHPKYDYLFSYGDTEGDKEMLEFANQSFFKPFE